MLPPGELVGAEKLHPNTFVGCRRAFRPARSHLVAARRHNAVKAGGRVARTAAGARRRKAQCVDRLAEIGITFTFAGSVSHQESQSTESMVTPSADIVIHSRRIGQSETSVITIGQRRKYISVAACTG